MPSQKKLYTERAQVMLIVSNRLRTALQIRNLSQKQFAQKLGITEVTASRYINGTRTPNANVIAKICKTLNISADWLLGLM
jgi:transcriptional regulator with XRE-family HTH domain